MVELRSCCSTNNLSSYSDYKMLHIPIIASLLLKPLFFWSGLCFKNVRTWNSGSGGWKCWRLQGRLVSTLHSAVVVFGLTNQTTPESINYATEATRRGRWHFWLCSIQVFPPQQAWKSTAGPSAKIRMKLLLALTHPAEGGRKQPGWGKKQWTSGRRRLTLQSHKHNPHTRPWSTNGTVKSHTKLWAALGVRSYLGVCGVYPRGQLIGALPQVMHSLVPPIACPAGHHGGEKTRKCSEAQQPVTWRVPNNKTFTEDYNSLCLSC